MFGRGVYFADTPLKSLQYTGGKLCGCVGDGRRYMLVCDVELGNQLETTSAKSSLKPETDLRRGGVPALLGQRSFDSVAAKPSLLGLRAPEFVVYKPAQAWPRYLLAVEQVPKDSADALGTVAEERAYKARARIRAAAAAASALKALEEAAVAKAMLKAEAEAAAVAATPQAEASSAAAEAEAAAAAVAAAAAAAVAEVAAAGDEDAAMRELLGGLWLERSGRFFWKRRWHALDTDRAALVHFTHDVSAVPLPRLFRCPLFCGALPLEAIRSVEASGDDCSCCNPMHPGCNPMRPCAQATTHAHRGRLLDAAAPRPSRRRHPPRAVRPCRRGSRRRLAPRRCPGLGSAEQAVGNRALGGLRHRARAARRARRRAAAAPRATAAQATACCGGGCLEAGGCPHLGRRRGGLRRAAIALRGRGAACNPVCARCSSLCCRLQPHELEAPTTLVRLPSHSMFSR